MASSSILTLSLQTPYIDTHGRQHFARDLVGKIVGLYFSVSWSPQCRDANPKIVKKYHQIQQQYPNQFEILFIPDDLSDSESYYEFFQTMPWLMLCDPTGAHHFHDDLGDYFELDELPAMVVLDREGKRLIDVDIDEFLEIPFDKMTDLSNYTQRCKELEEEMMNKMPETIYHSSHRHPLKKTLNPYKKSGFDCDLCDKRITLERFYNFDDAWSYHCEECGYDLHAVCASKDNYHQMLCSVPNIDHCIDCGESYVLTKVEITEENPTGTDYACPSRCVHPPPSEITRQYLNIGINSINNSLPPWNRTLLHSAVAASDPDLVWYLLKKGANPYLLDHLGISPCMLARDLWTQIALSKHDDVVPETANLYSRAKLVYEMLPKAPDMTAESNSLDLPQLPVLQISRAHSEGGVIFRSSTSTDQLPLLRDHPIKTRRRKHHGPSLDLESIPVPTKIGLSKSIRSEIICPPSGDPGSLLDRGMQPFTSLTLTRLTSENEVQQSQSDWTTLQRLTFSELSRGIIDPDISLGSRESKDKLPSPNSRLQHKVQCNACLDEFPFLCLGYSCSRIGCGGALCVDCLGRLAYVTITGALYAVPMLKCPLCHDRISTILWSNALGSVPATPEQIAALKPADHSSNLDDFDTMISGITDIVVTHIENFSPEVDKIKVDDDLVIELVNIFEALQKLFKHHQVSYGQFLDHLSHGRIEPSDRSMNLKQFTLNLEAFIHNADTASDPNQWSQFYLSNRSDLEAAIIGLVENSEYDQTPDRFFNTIQDLIVPFVIYLSRFIPGVIALLSDELEDNEDENEKNLGELLLSKYLANADALLKLLCGQCHQTVGLFYIPANGFAIPSTSVEREHALNEILNRLPESQHLPFLRTFLSYSSGNLSSVSFLQKIYRFRSPFTRDDRENEDTLPSGISESTRDFFRHILSLLYDIERRLTAQLTLLRAFPKIYTPCCGTAHCFMCKTLGHHLGKSCEEVQQKEVGIAAQNCRGCGVPTLRTEGCSSITCVCGMTWEWVDGEDEERNDMNGDADGDDEWEDCDEES